MSASSEATAERDLQVARERAAEQWRCNALVLVRRCACFRAIASMRAMADLAPKLREHGQLLLFRNIEMPLLSVVADSEYHGLPFDAKFFTTLKEDIIVRQNVIEGYLSEHVHENFNPSSPKDVKELRVALTKMHEERVEEFLESLLNPAFHVGVDTSTHQKDQLTFKNKSSASASISSQIINQVVDIPAGLDSPIADFTLTVPRDRISSTAMAAAARAVPFHPLLALAHEHASLSRSLLPLCGGVLAQRYLDRVRGCASTIGSETGRMSYTNPPLQMVRQLAKIYALPYN